MIGLVTPLGALVQMGRLSVGQDCSARPGVAGLQEMTAKPGPAGSILSVGEPGVATTAGKAQKPPTRVKLPPLIAGPASGCPMVPTRLKPPPTLDPPPPSI